MGPAGRKVAAALAVLLCTVLVVLAAAPGAGAEQPVRVRTGNLDLRFNGGIRPKRISRTKLTPISFALSGRIGTVDGSQPPPLREFVLETDRDGVVDVAGFPVCPASRLQSQDVAAAESVCRAAIVGRGETSVEISLPERQPMRMRSPLLVVNGGRRGGVTTLYLYGYFDSPVATAFVVPVSMTRIPGRYGLRSVARIPEIAGGAGSMTGFSFEIDRKANRAGRRLSVVSARCDGVLEARGEAVFADGMVVEGSVLRPCTPVG